MERGARGIVLSEAGAQLLTRARFLLTGVAGAVAEIAELNNEPSGLVRVPPLQALATSYTRCWPSTWSDGCLRFGSNCRRRLTLPPLQPCGKVVSSWP